MSRRAWGFILNLTLMLLGGVSAHASGPVGSAIQGTLFAPGGSPVTSSNVSFKIQILDKSSSCMLYEETFSGVSLSSTNGDFALELGGGTSAQNYIDSTAVLKNNVFRNDVNIATAVPGCAGGVTFASGDERLIRVMFDAAGGTSYSTLTPDMKLMSSPYSTITQSLQGKIPTDFIQVKDDGSTDLNQTNVESIFSSTNFDKLQRFLNGTANVPYSLNNQRIINVGTPTASTDATTKAYADGFVGGKTSDTTGISGSAGDGATLIWNQSQNKWVTGTPSATDNTKLPLSGGAMTGTLSMGGHQIYNTGHISMGNQTVLQLGQFTDLQETALTLGGADGGKLIFNTDKNLVRAWNGSTFTGFSPSGTAAGDLSGSFPNPTIANDAVTSAKINSSGIASNRLLSTDASSGGTVTYVGCAIGQVMSFDVNGKWLCRSAVDLLTAGTTAGDILKWNGSAWLVGADADAGGDIQSVTVGTGLSGGGVTGAVTVSLSNTPVTAASFGSASQVATFEVNQQGRLTQASNINIAIDPTAITQYSASPGQVLKWNGSAWLPAAATSGSVTFLAMGTGLLGGPISTTGTINIDTGIGANQIPQLDANGFLGIGTATVTTGAALEIFGTSNSNSSIILPRANTANRPTGVDGMIRYNTSLIKFEVYENSNWVTLLTSTTGADNLGNHTATLPILAIAGTGSAPSYAFVNDTDTGFYSPAAGVVALTTNSTERLRVDASGSLGLGVSPSYAFHLRKDQNTSTQAVFQNFNAGASAFTKISVGANVASTTLTAYSSGNAASRDGQVLSSAGELLFTGTAKSFVGNSSLAPLYLATNDLIRLTILGSGNVGIGTTVPGYALEVVGTTANDSGTWALRSDERLKTNIHQLENSLDTVLQLRGVTFNWKDPLKNQQMGLQRGFIAQEVEKVIPEWVHTGNDGYKRLEKVGVEAYIIEAIKDLYNKYIQPLIRNDENQDRELAFIKERIFHLEIENTQLKQDKAVKIKELEDIKVRLDRLEKNTVSK